MPGISFGRIVFLCLTVIQFSLIAQTRPRQVLVESFDPAASPSYQLVLHPTGKQEARQIYSSQLRLEPGDALLCHMPAEQVLVLRLEGARMQHLRFWVAFDGLLFQEFQPEFLNEKEVLLLDHPEARVYRVELDLGAPEGCDLIRQLAVYDAVPPLIARNKLLPEQGRSLELEFPGERRFSQYLPVGPGDLLTFDTRGRRQLVFESRLSYEDQSPLWRRSYQIRVGTCQPDRVFNHQTAPLTREQILFRGEPLLLGRLRYTVVDLPEDCDQISFSVSAPLFLRVSDPEDLYLLDGSNRDPETPPQADEPFWWLRSARNLNQQQPDRVQVLGTALGCWNSGSRETALALLASMEEQLPKPRTAQDQQNLEALYQRHSYWRGLRPLPTREPVTHRVKRFTRAALKNDLEQGPIFVPPRFPAESGRPQASESFYLLQPGQQLEFPVPELPVRAQLRFLAIRPPHPADLILSSGTGPQQEYHINPDLPRPWQDSDPALYAFWGWNGTGLPLARASSQPVEETTWRNIELQEANPRKIILRRTDENPQDLWVCIQVRRSRTFDMDELEYAENQAHIQRRPLEIFKDLVQGQLKPLPDSVQEAHLLEETRLAWHLEPLAERMLFDQNSFNQDADCLPLSPIKNPDIDPDQVRQLRQQAMALEKEGRASEALALWSRLVLTRDDPNDRIQMNLVLLDLNEHYLAQVDLEAMFQQAADRQSRRMVMDLLLEIYRLKADELSLIQLLTTSFLKEYQPQDLMELVRAYMDQGDFHFALDALLLLENPPPDLLGLMALADNRPQLAREASGRLPAGPLKNELLGLAAAKSGEYELARQFLKEAQNPDWLAFLDQGLILGEALVSPQHRQRARALLDLESWWARHPGPKRFEDAESLIRSDQGCVQAWNRALDLFADYHLTGESNPLRLEVNGPARLKLELRPLHHPDQLQKPQSGFYDLETDGLRRLGSYSENQPTNSWFIPGQTSIVPGSALYEELELGPGLHQITLRGSLLVRVQQEKPLLFLAPLPELTPDVVLAVLQGRFQRPENLFSTGQPGTEPQPLMDPWTSLKQSPPLSPLEEARLLLRLPDLDREERQHLSRWLDQLNPEERTQAMLRLYPGNHQLRPLLEQVCPEIRRGLLLRENRIDEALAIDPGPGANGRAEMTLLMQLFQQNPQHWEKLQVQALRLIQAFPRELSLESMARPLTQLGTWNRVGYFEGGAGMVSLEDDAQSSFLQTRTALVPQDQSSTLLLGNQRMGVSFTDGEPGPLRLMLAVENVGSLKPEALTAFYQWQEGARVSLNLEPSDSWTILELPIPEIAQHLTIGALAPMVNQFLRVRLLEERASGPVPLQKEVGIRQFEVATHEEPLILKLFEPARLRVDRYLDNRVVSEEVLVQDSPAVLEWRPEPGQSELWLRIYRRVHEPFAVAPERARPQTTWSGRESEMAVTCPEPAVREPESRLTFYVQPPRFMSGEVQIELVNRELSDNEDFSRANRDRYLEFSHSWLRHWREPIFSGDLFAELKLMYRRRIAGFDSVGVTADAMWQKDRFRVAADLGVFTQFLQPFVLPDGSYRREFEDPITWRGRLDLEMLPVQHDKLSYATELRLFNHFLDMDREPPGPLDWDVFTSYRVHHQYGFRLTGKLRYRPYADGQLKLDVAMTSNEDITAFLVDNYRLQLSWDQLIGPFNLEPGLVVRQALADDYRLEQSLDLYPGIDLAWEDIDESGRRRSMALRTQINLEDRALNFGLRITNGYQMRGDYYDYMPDRVPYRLSHIRRRQLERLYLGVLDAD